jgi:hypothetical protein|tara:strand:+ start:23391 stop:25001 length:1611 start_codon:yes stop_codon:yes gene_type:complete
LKNVFTSRSFITLFLLILFLLSLRVDYRFIETINCCGDDHTYFVHAETIAEDFDLDYSNQMNFVEGKTIIVNEKVVPIGFIGSGILSAPFMYFGILIDNLLDTINVENSRMMNYKILLYSLSPVIYLFLTIFIFIKLLQFLNIKNKTYFVFVVLFGSGVHYYAFERYSMTHIYEVFLITLLIYLLCIFYKSDNVNNFVSIIIPIIFLLAYLVRYINYFIFVIPFWISKLIIKDTDKKLIKNKLFIMSSITSLGIFSYISNYLYGRISFNPIVVYNKQSFPLLNQYVDKSVERGNFLLDNLSILTKMFFTQEFGIIWFTPIVVFGITAIFFDLLKKYKKQKLPYLVLLLTIGFPIGITLIWETVGSGYGMRYIYCVVPICLLVYLVINHQNNMKYLNYLLISLSIFSFFSVLFFETSASTSLSEQEVVNTWGYMVRYAQPNYLSGVFSSFLNFGSYLIIFGTSFFGAIIIKFLSSLMGLDEFILSLSNIGISVDNADVLRIFNNIDSINGHKFIFIFFMFFFVARYFSKIITKELAI